VRAHPLMGGFSIANYLLYYARSGVDPFTGAVPAAILAPAMSISYVTIMVCQLVSMIQRRSVHGFFSRYQFSNPSFSWGHLL
jgi:P-type Ca2+ transporter type 2C